MKKISVILTAAILLSACSIPARAQQYGYTALNTATDTNSTIPATSQTNIACTFSATKVDDFTLAVSFKLMGAGTSALTFQWDMSPDGTNWTSVKNGHTHGWFTGPSANGTTTVSWNTNISMGPVGYYRINYITNGSATVVTNLDIRAYSKPRRNG